MDTMRAFLMGELHRHKEERVFDWELAARIIKMQNPQVVRAGLSMDWSYTGGTIWREGKPVPKEDTYTFLASTWATPEIECDGETLPCFRMQSDTPGWNHSTYWPPEALRILGILEDGVLEGEIVEDSRQLSSTTTISVPLLTAGDPDEA